MPNWGRVHPATAFLGNVVVDVVGGRVGPQLRIRVKITPDWGRVHPAAILHKELVVDVVRGVIKRDKLLKILPKMFWRQGPTKIHGQSV
jgi:hypothetical protein